MFERISRKFICWAIMLLSAQITSVASAQIPEAISNQASMIHRFINQIDGMTADEAVAAALANNGELAASRQELAAARALVEQARLRANPSVELSGTRQLAGKDNSLMVTGMLPLELSGRRSARIAVAMREVEVRAKAVSDRERLLAAEVRLKFAEATAQTLKLKLTEELLDTITQGFRLVQARVTEGKIAPLEENITLVEVNRMRSLREAEVGKTAIAMLELRTLLGMKPDEPLLLRGVLENTIAPLPPLTVTTTSALQTRPDLAAMRAMENLAEAQIEQARTEGRFDASVTAGYQRMNSSFPVSGFNDAGVLSPVEDVFHFFTFGVTLNLPIRNRNQGTVKAAIANLEAARNRREFAELIVRREVAAAFVRYESAARTMEIFRVGVRGQANANLEVVRQTYELGSRTLLDYIAEQRRYIEIENDFIDTQLAVYQARIEILRAAAAPELTKQ